MTRVGKQIEVISSYQNGPIRDRPQATSEQLRLAKLTQSSEDQEQMRDKVRKVIELTKCTEQQALLALHDSEQNVMNAVNSIFDGSATKDGEWITKQGKKAKRAAAQHQNHDLVNGEIDPDEPSFEQNGGGFRSAGRGGRGGFRSGSDQPPRFNGRGGGPPRRGGAPSGNFSGRGNKENETNSIDSRGRGRGRSSSGRESSERGRFRSKGQNDGESGGGFGYWQGGNSSSNTWDNRMATEAPAPDTNASNTWDNSMAEHLNAAARSPTPAPQQPQQTPPQPQTPHQQQHAQSVSKKQSNEWNNNSASDEWNQEETEWNKQTLVFTATNSSNRKSPSPATAIATQIQQDKRQTSDTGTPNTHYRAVDSVPPSVGDIGSLPGSVSWSQQATNSLKNELGIGKQSTAVSNSMPTTSSSHGVSDLQRTAKVEMPFEVGSGPGSMDIQFGFTVDDLNPSAGGIDYYSGGQKLQAVKQELVSQNGVGAVNAGMAPNHGLGQVMSKEMTVTETPVGGYAHVGSMGGGTSGAAAVPQPPINPSPQKMTQGLTQQQQQLTQNAVRGPGSSLSGDIVASQPEPFTNLNVSVPPPGFQQPTLNTSLPSNVNASWNSNAMTSSINSKTTSSSTSTKPNPQANIFNQAPAQAPYFPGYQVANSLMTYQSAAAAAAAGLQMRPEDLLAMPGLIMNPMDFTNFAQYLPQVSVGSSAGTRDTSFTNTVPTQSVMKQMGGGGTSLSSASVDPPPGFAQPSQSNAAQAAQLIAAQQAAQQLTAGAYGGVHQLPFLMQPTAQTLNAQQFQKSAGLGQNNYPAMMPGYDLNDMDLKSGGGNYGNNSQTNKALLSGPSLASLGLDPKSYSGAQPVNKNYDTKFGSGVTNTPPPGMGAMAGFTGFAQPSAFPYGGGGQAYLGAPPTAMLHSPAGLGYGPPTMDQRSNPKGNLQQSKYPAYTGSWNGGPQN